MTFHIRVFLLVVLLAMAGCMPAKNARGPVSTEPGVPAVTDRDAGNATEASCAPVNDGAEVSAQEEGLEPLDASDTLPEADGLSADERKILDTELPFHAGLDTQGNADVQRYFHYYTHVHRGTMDGWLKRAQRYLPHIRQRFLAEGLPEDLIYLPFAESGFNPFAVSRAGACGVWQFMPQTAINNGLVVDSWVDERRDPYKSTEAAITYLKKLYAEFGDWPLALAAYNAGEGAVGRALKKTGSEDFFTLCETSTDLKQETKLYVPKFMALVKIARNLDKLGFEPLDLDRRLTPPVRLRVKPGTDLLGLAKNMGMDWKAFREMNPSFRKQEAPPSRAVNVDVPGHLVAKAEEYLKRPVAPKKVDVASYRVRPGDTWWGVAKKHGVAVKDLQAANTVKKLSVGQSLRIPGVVAPADDSTVADARVWATKRANYAIRQGDTVWSIARQFNTDPATLLKANGLQKNTVLKVGQKIFVPDAGTAEQKTARVQADNVRKEMVSYQVRAGDNLWSIARRFGVSPDDLREWNKLAANAQLRPGDQIKVFSR